MGTLGAVRFFPFYCSRPIPNKFHQVSAHFRWIYQKKKKTGLYPLSVTSPTQLPGCPHFILHQVHFLSVYFFSVYTRSTPVEAGGRKSSNFWRRKRHPLSETPEMLKDCCRGCLSRKCARDEPMPSLHCFLHSSCMRDPSADP